MFNKKQTQRKKIKITIFDEIYSWKQKGESKFLREVGLISEEERNIEMFKSLFGSYIHEAISKIRLLGTNVVGFNETLFDIIDEKIQENKQLAIAGHNIGLIVYLIYLLLQYKHIHHFVVGRLKDI